MWDPLIKISNTIIDIFNSRLEKYEIEACISHEGWSNFFWKSDKIRKCHLEIIDVRDTKKIFVMHINIFPDEYSDIPILGFDVIAGQNKITGLFFDFSPVTDKHYYLNYLIDKTEKMNIIKHRDIPDWGKPIFSDYIIATGNIRTEEDLNYILDICVELLHFYLDNLDIVKLTDKLSYKEKHNLYCKQQKLNPHLHRSLLGMGLDEKTKTEYIDKIVFEEL